MSPRQTTPLQRQLAALSRGESRRLDLGSSSGVTTFGARDYQSLQRHAKQGALDLVDTLAFRESLVDPEWWKRLVCLSPFMPRLTCIDLYRWEIGDLGVRCLCDAARDGHLASLRYLDLGWTGLGDTGVAELVDARQSFSALETLRLEWATLSAASMERLGRSVLGFPSLRSLTLRNVGLDTERLRALLGAWDVAHPTLIDLDLSHNPMHDHGARLLAGWLQRAATELRSLQLSNTRLGADGALAMATMWKRGLMSNVYALDVSANWLGSSGIAAWAEALENAGIERCETLNFSANQAGPIGCAALCNALRKANTLSVLDLSDNAIGSQGARLVANLDSQCPSLTTLNIAHNDIDDLGLRPLLDALLREPWASSLKSFVAKQRCLEAIPQEVIESREARIWRDYASQLPAVPTQLQDAVNRSPRVAKRAVAEFEKSILALLDTCLAWPEDAVSARRLARSALLIANRKQVGLKDAALPGATTVHNHLVYLAKRCGMPTLLEVSQNRQAARFKPGALSRLAQLRPSLQAEIVNAEQLASAGM